MKKLLKLFGIIALAAVIGLTMTACGGGDDGGGGPTKFEGSWRHLNPQAQNTTITFTGNSFTYTGPNPKNGTFTFNDSNITLSASDGSRWVSPYQFGEDNNGPFLRLDLGTGFWGGWYGNFYKQ